MVNCTLCLSEIFENTSLPIDDFTEKLQFCFPKQKFNFSHEDYICEFCIILLNNQFDFKNVCLCESAESENENCGFICRICTKEVIDDDLIFVSIQNESEDSQIAMKILKTCFRKVYNKIIFISMRKNPIICYGCWRNLKNFYTFFKMIVKKSSTKKRIARFPRKKKQFRYKCDNCDFKTSLKLTLKNHKLLNHPESNSDSGEIDIISVDSNEEISKYFHNYHKSSNFTPRKSQAKPENHLVTEQKRRQQLREQLIHLHNILYPGKPSDKFSQIKVMSAAVEECKKLRANYHQLNRKTRELEMQKSDLLAKMRSLQESLPF